jgi:hypothetical protein
MTDNDLKLLYRWSREELNNGNRSKASKIRKVYDKFREIRGNTTRLTTSVSHIDTLDVELLLEDLALQCK